MRNIAALLTLMHAAIAWVPPTPSLSNMCCLCGVEAIHQKTSVRTGAIHGLWIDRRVHPDLSAKPRMLCYPICGGFEPFGAELHRACGQRAQSDGRCGTRRAGWRDLRWPLNYGVLMRAHAEGGQSERRSSMNKGRASWRTLLLIRSGPEHVLVRGEMKLSSLSIEILQLFPIPASVCLLNVPCPPIYIPIGLEPVLALMQWEHSSFKRPA